MGGVLAIDHGDLKCGFAATDGLRIARTALGVFRHEGREEDLLRHLDGLLSERDISTLVVGLPLHMDGRPGPRAGIVRAFVRRLAARYPALEIQEWDERLTSKEAEGRLREQGRTGREIRRERDSWSALVLLEDWLGSHPAG